MNNDFDVHYRAFQWAVSKNWKDKNRLYRSIQEKIRTLVDEYGLTPKDIADELFENYWTKSHYRKFDDTRGSLNNWIAGYVYFYLNHMIRKYAVRAKQTDNRRLDPLDQRNWADIEWIDRGNERDDPNFQPDILIDTNNPESLLIAKETLEFACDHFTKPQMAYMTGEMELEEAAVVSGITPEAFRKRLDRKRADFCQAYSTIGSTN